MAITKRLAKNVVTAKSDPITGEIKSLSAQGQDIISFEYGDNLTNPSVTTTLTGLISAAAVLSVAANATYRKARVSWINNGASPSAKLFISVNPDNDVHGLVASQAKSRRDHEMTIGDAIVIVCDYPISRLVFSSDSSVAANAHRLIVTFGE